MSAGILQVKLSESIPTILAFDGEILECFFDEGGSKRIHVSHIKGARLEPSGQGRRLLTIQLKHDQLLLWVDEPVIPRVLELLNSLLEKIR